MKDSKNFDPDVYLPPTPENLRSFLALRSGAATRLAVLKRIVADGYALGPAVRLMRKHYGRAPDAGVVSKLRQSMQRAPKAPKAAPARGRWEPWVPLDTEIRDRLKKIEENLAYLVRAWGAEDPPPEVSNAPDA